MRWISILLLSVICVTPCLGATLVKYHGAVEGANPHEAYYAALLRLALEETQQEFGPFELQPVYTDYPQGRSIAALQSGKLFDVIWTMTSIEREEELLPVHVPLLKGLMGYRLFLIARDRQQEFAGIKTLEQLKRLRCGQSIDWPDTQILRGNEFNVVTAPAERLHAMLAAHRFDIFPRSIHEIWDEVTAHPRLVVEQNLMLHYPAPMYFFVSRKNPQLAQRLTLGLHRAVANGQFDEMFEAHRMTGDTFTQGNLLNRTVIQLDNPQLSGISRQVAKLERYQLKMLHQDDLFSTDDSHQ